MITQTHAGTCRIPSTTHSALGSTFGRILHEDRVLGGVLGVAKCHTGSPAGPRQGLGHYETTLKHLGSSVATYEPDILFGSGHSQTTPTRQDPGSLKNNLVSDVQQNGNLKFIHKGTYQC